MTEIVSAKTFKRLVLIYQFGLVLAGVATGAFVLTTLLKAPILSLLPMDILIGTMIWH
jgi:hypothetical protein